VSLIRVISNILFPSLCIICKNAYSIKGEQLCVTCASDLPYTDHFQYKNNEFVQHFWGRVPIIAGCALLSYSSESGLVLRGYNQSASIALGLHEIWKVPIWTDVLVRSKSTDTQTQKSRAERSESMMNSFRFQRPEKYRKRHVLLIDDVMTTGATLEACGAALLKGTSVQLSMMTLAMGHY